MAAKNFRKLFEPYTVKSMTLRTIIKLIMNISYQSATELIISTSGDFPIALPLSPSPVA